MPGLRLTLSQAKRLWGLDEQTCAQALQLLIAVRFLDRRADGTHRRLANGAVPYPPAAYGQGRSHDNGGPNARPRTITIVMTSTQPRPHTATALAVLW